MPRTFEYDGRRFPDPDPHRTPDEIRLRMADHFPELNQATTETFEEPPDTVYRFRRRVGTKGADFPNRVIFDGLASVAPVSLDLYTMLAQNRFPNGQTDFDAIRNDPSRLDNAIAQANVHASQVRALNEQIHQLFLC